jgi:dimethylhistidine N-methyltransferase
LSQESIRKTLGYKKFVVDSRLNYFKSSEIQYAQRFAEEISQSLNEKPKRINPKYFYDDRGSALFDKICKLPEYYLTRLESKILQSIEEDLIFFLPKKVCLVELGSGSSEKTRIILDILSKNQSIIEYFPIDASNVLIESATMLRQKYDNLKITGIIDTFERGLEFIKEYDDCAHLIAFLGSSFGNFTIKDGIMFLQKINSQMKNDDLFLIGLDLVKEKQILEKAYDDSQGITAAFNLNVLLRINEELDADFDFTLFEHHVKYDKKNQRIDMYLRSLVTQSITIPKANVSVHFKKDELIHTEHSHKYSIPQIKQLMETSGFKINKIWLDENHHYALVLASKNNFY